MRRREFVRLLGGALAWPVAARAQLEPIPVIGFLSNSSRRFDDDLRLAPFHEGLREAGNVEGRNVATEYYGAEDHYDRLPTLAADLVRRQPAVIVTLGGPTTALAAKAATTAVPIVFTITGDPVNLGLVASFNRPGGNVTGVATFSNFFVVKQFEALHETVPTVGTFGCLVNPNNPNTETDTREAEAAARGFGLELKLLDARNESEIETAFAALVQKRLGAVVVVADGFFNSRPGFLAALAARYAIPTIFSELEFAKAGGLMSYGASLAANYRQAGWYAGRILKGGKPADLPVMQLARGELAINIRTAKTLGISFPFSLLGRADEVIE